jgi:hypothetical protein
LAAQGLHRLAAHGFFAAQGLHGLLAAQGLHPLAAQGLHPRLAAHGFFAAHGFWATFAAPCQPAAGPGSVVSVTPPMPTPTPITSGITVVDNSRFLNGFMV